MPGKCFSTAMGLSSSFHIHGGIDIEHCCLKVAAHSLVAAWQYGTAPLGCRNVDESRRTTSFPFANREKKRHKEIFQCAAQPTKDSVCRVFSQALFKRRSGCFRITAWPVSHCVLAKQNGKRTFFCSAFVDRVIPQAIFFSIRCDSAPATVWQEWGSPNRFCPARPGCRLP